MYVFPSKVTALRPWATMHSDRDWISSPVGPAGLVNR